MLLLNHPGLIGRHIEDLTEITFSSAEAGALHDTLLASAAAAHLPAQAGDETSPDAPSLRTAVEGQGFGAILQQLDGMAAHASHWYTKAGAADADADEVLKQALSLHRPARTLHRELQLAELALGKDSQRGQSRPSQGYSGAIVSTRRDRGRSGRLWHAIGAPERNLMSGWEELDVVLAADPARLETEAAPGLNSGR